MLICFVVFFFFKQKTAYEMRISDWSSDVCSSDLSDLPEDLIRSVKLYFEDLVIESLRAKNFSHSAINETAKELGNVNRTLVAENFRGYSLKIGRASCRERVCQYV